MSAEAQSLAESLPSFAGDIGIGRQDMTPEAGIYCHNWGAATHEVADSIHRPLYAYAIAFRAAVGAAPVIIATVDYSWFLAHETVHELREPLLREHGLTDEQLWLSVTHSHSVPHIDVALESKPGGEKIPAFREKLKSALADAVRSALVNLAPATLTFATGQSRLARRRDFIDPDSGRILCGPRPYEIADSTLLVGRITGTDGEIRGTLVNYACHPVSLGAGNTSVSPDYVGALRAIVEDHTHAPCIFIHGASGDQTPRDSYSSDPRVADRNGASVAHSVIAVLYSMLPPGERLEFAHTQQSGAPLAIFETRPYEVDRTVASARIELSLPARDWPTLAEIDARIAAAVDSPPERVRMERLKAYVANLAALNSGFPVWALRLGDIYFVGTPAEAFTDLQLALRVRFPRAAVLVANDVNGSFNYLPPAAYYGNGAYEQESADFGPGSLEKVIQGAGALIAQLRSRGAR